MRGTAASGHKVERFGWVFAPGDKVMQIENDYDKEVYNGDIGYVVMSTPTLANSLPASTDVSSPTALVSLTPWCRPTP